MGLLVSRMSGRIRNIVTWKFSLRFSKISTGKKAASTVGLAVLMKKLACRDYRR